MYKYIIRTFDPERFYAVELLHEKELTKEEFSEIAAECFALAIKEDCDAAASYLFKEQIKEDVDLESRLYLCADIMKEKYGFIESQQPTQIFSVNWFITREECTPNSELIFKHIDKLLTLNRQ